MLDSSNAFREAISKNSATCLEGTLNLASGSVIELTPNDFMEGSVRFEDSSSAVVNFPLGLVSLVHYQ